MKIKLLVMIFICLTSFVSQAQSEEYKIKFSYDSAGNQILRDRVCVNCTSSKSTVTKKELIEEIAEEEINVDEIENKESLITAYPNPVTDLLHVSWIESQNAVVQLSVFRVDGRMLNIQNVNSLYGELNLDFSRYPSGIYLLLVTYQDNYVETIKVVKK